MRGIVGGMKAFVRSAAFWLGLAGIAGGWIEARAGDAVSPALSGQAQPVSAEAKPDRVIIRVGNAPFTEYIFPDDSKYPYFYPVLGPRSGKTVTVHKTEPYPHHSSIFFGCDRVNGGNYWQEGLDRGRIVSKSVRIIHAGGDRIEFEQDCAWERPGAESPFADHRRIAVSAPSADVRFIDFDVTLTAQTDVKIEKTNHSLFSVRVAPELAVKAGGTLINAAGDLAEKGTFGKPAAWADYRGTRDGFVEGVAILSHPQNRWFPEPWFTRDYGFMSPTPMEWLPGGQLQIAKGEKLHLRYRAVIHAGAPSQAQLGQWFADWVKQ